MSIYQLKNRPRKYDEIKAIQSGSPGPGQRLEWGRGRPRKADFEFLWGAQGRERPRSMFFESFKRNPGRGH